MAYVAIADRDHPMHDPQTWIEKYVWSQDHKVIAIQYGSVAIGVGLVALALSLLMRLQIGFPDTFSFITPYNYYQFVTMHGMIMVIYLLTALFLGGFGNYLIPLMCGARDMVFPYMNMLSFWVYLLSVIILLASFFVSGGPTGGGWTLYPPQTVLEGTPGHDWGILLMLLSLATFIVAFTMGGLNYVTTVLQARCRGMTLMRMPLSVWGIFVATILGLLAFPALLVAAIMMILDRLIGTSFFMPAIMSLGEINETNGGSPVLFQHLFWFFGHPEVYIVALPAFGIVSDLLSTHARKNIFGYRMMVWAIIAIGALSFIVWAHHMYVSGMNPYFGFFFATTTLIIAIPTAIKVYNWVLTLWRGDIQLNIPNLFAIGFIFTFVHGGLTGLFLGNVTVDLPLSDTYFVIGHFHMVMGVSPVMVLFGAIYHWFPKISGKMPNELLGRIHFWMTFLGTYAIYLPMHYIGILGMPRRYYAYGTTDFIPESAHAVNEAITIAAIVVAVGAADIPRQRVLQPAQGQAGARQPVGRDDARVADAADTARARQLGTEATRRLSLGLRLQRARRAEGLHPAERAAERPLVAGPQLASAHSTMLSALFIAMLTAITVWWLLIQRLKDKPWLKQGVVPTSQETVTSSAPKVGLWVFLAVVSSLFGLFASAYTMRMGGHSGLVSWQAARRAERAVDQHARPRARERRDANCAQPHRRRRLQGRAVVLPRRGRVDGRVPRRPSAGVAAGCERAALGPDSPAFSFFVLLTATHGLHLIGGLWVLGRTTARIFRGSMRATSSRAAAFG